MFSSPKLVISWNSSQKKLTYALLGKCVSETKQNSSWTGERREKRQLSGIYLQNYRGRSARLPSYPKIPWSKTAKWRKTPTQTKEPDTITAVSLHFLRYTIYWHKMAFSGSHANNQLQTLLITNTLLVQLFNDMVPSVTSRSHSLLRNYSQMMHGVIHWELTSLARLLLNRLY